jgi:hypothetical protein
MNKPWDNQPTPITDAAQISLKAGALGQPYDAEEVSYLAGVDAALKVAREIERRLEYSMQLMADAADRLLNEEANNE